MKLTYTGLDGEAHIVNATITTNHAASSYGQPVVVLDDGQPLDAMTWYALGYQVVDATDDERALLRRLGLG